MPYRKLPDCKRRPYLQRHTAPDEGNVRVHSPLRRRNTRRHRARLRELPADEPSDGKMGGRQIPARGIGAYHRSAAILSCPINFLPTDGEAYGHALPIQDAPSNPYSKPPNEHHHPNRQSASSPTSGSACTTRAFTALRIQRTATALRHGTRQYFLGKCRKDTSSAPTG